MSDFAALLEAATFEPKKTYKRGSDYDGPIDPVVVTIVERCLANSAKATFPIADEETFEKFAEQLAAQARKLDKSATVSRVLENKGEPNEKLVGLSVTVGEKRGKRAADTADAPAADNAEAAK